MLCGGDKRTRHAGGVSNGQVNFMELDKTGESTRIRLGCTVVRVEHEGSAEKSDFVRVTYTHNGKVYRLKAGGGDGRRRLDQPSTL